MYYPKFEIMNNTLIYKCFGLLIGCMLMTTWLPAQHKKMVQSDRVEKDAVPSISDIERLDVMGTVSCPFSLEPNHFHLPLDEARLSAIKKSRLKNSSDIVVQYFDFPEEAIPPFEFIVEVLEELFPSDIPINVGAQFSDQVGAGTLASAGSTSFFRNFDNQIEPNTWYPISLAEKIVGIELNADDNLFDIIVTINAQQDWYYDFNNPQGIGGRFDFVSIVMHEILHGLGMTSASDVTSNIGFIESQGSSFIYDIFLENSALINLSQSFDNNSLELGSALRSGDVFFGSNWFKINTPNDIPRIFSPMVWNQGSSISHLDEGTYNNTPHALMTPTAQPGEIIQDPGLVMDMMYDMGWSLTLMRPIHESFSEDVNAPFNFDVRVDTDFGFDTSSLRMFFFEGDFSILSQENVPLVYTGVENIFRATLPAPNERRSINYYYQLDDNRDLRVSNPSNSPSRFYSFTWGLDDIAPEISHVPIASINENESAITISTTITDEFTGVDTVYATVEVVGKSSESFPLIPTFDNFGALIYEETYTLPVRLDTTDQLRYQIFARDLAGQPNSIFSPASGFYNIEIVGVPGPITFYQNDFDSPSDDFFGEGFTVETPNGFESPAIHSLHPYGDAESRGVTSFDLTYQLRNPIIVSGLNSSITFEEIVLVEPGEPNVPFPQSQFWDYVVMEGKKLLDSDWIPLADGYDSRAQDVWLDAYNESFSPCPDVAPGAALCISDAVGDVSLFTTRRLDIVENGAFAAGDTIQLRFRLFSDPLSFGWGWAIDNLSIQAEEILVKVDEIESLELQQALPNPSNLGYVDLAYKFASPEELNTLKVYNIQGATVYSERLSSRSAQSYSKRLDTTAWTEGIYFIELATDTGISTQRVVIAR